MASQIVNEGALIRYNIAIATASGALRALHGDNPLVKYNVNRPYASYYAFIAKRLVEQQVYKKINTIIPDMIQKQQKAAREKRDTQLKDTNETIIKNGQLSTGDLTTFKTSDDQQLVATDIYGRKDAAVGALFIAYTSPDNKVWTYEWFDEETDPNGVMKTLAKDVLSKDVVVWDPAPNISINSKKNVNLTPVVGRDHSRKELISNGDVSFHISGKFVSRNPDVYPANEVKRFIDIMRHQDIIRVQNMFFAQHNIDHIVITDYNLPTPTCLNEQPYSFSCVGVEPSEEGLKQDTLVSQIYTQETSQLEGWYNNILVKYLINQMGALNAQTIATTGELVSGGLDKLIK